MNKLSVSLLVGAAALFASAAQAAPLTNGMPSIASGVENVRMVCNENGRCWRERRGSRTVIIERDRDSYNYVPRRERHYHGHGHGHVYGHGHGPGVGIHAPGVSIGIGGGGHRW
jgi:hypothetical protein